MEFLAKNSLKNIESQSLIVFAKVLQTYLIYELRTGDTEKYDLNSNGSFFATSKTTDTDHLGKFTQKILAHSKN